MTALSGVLFGIGQSPVATRIRRRSFSARECHEAISDGTSNGKWSLSVLAGLSRMSAELDPSVRTLGISHLATETRNRRIKIEKIGLTISLVWMKRSEGSNRSPAGYRNLIAQRQQCKLVGVGRIPSPRSQFNFDLD